MTKERSEYTMVILIIGGLCVMVTVYAVVFRFLDPMEKPLPNVVRNPARVTQQKALPGAPSTPPLRAGVTSVKFIQSVDPKRSFEVALADGGIQYCFGFDSWKKESQQDCAAFAQLVLAERRKKPDVDAVSVVISTRSLEQPYYRFRWKRPAGVKLGDYAGYVVEEQLYE